MPGTIINIMIIINITIIILNIVLKNHYYYYCCYILYFFITEMIFFIFFITADVQRLQHNECAMIHWICKVKISDKISCNSLLKVTSAIK